MAQTRKNVTIRDVAREAGLSYSTVSLVLNDKADKYHLRPTTVQRVHEAATRLGYVRNANANLFRTGQRQNLVGLLVPGLDTTIYSEIVHGIEQELGKEGNFLVVAGVNYEIENEEKYLEEFVSYRFAGVIDLTLSYEPERYHLLKRMGIPLIMMQTIPGECPEHYISFDDGHATLIAVRHLAARKCRRVAFLDVAPHRNMFLRVVAAARREGCQRGADEAGVPFAAIHVDFTMTELADRMREVAAETAGGVGLICNGDVLAARAIKALRAAGARVPEDVAIIGIGNEPIADLIDPALTTVDLPRYQLGIELGQTMLQLMHDVRERRSSRKIQRLLQPNLIVRDSA